MRQPSSQELENRLQNVQATVPISFGLSFSQHTNCYRHLIIARTTICVSSSKVTYNWQTCECISFIVSLTISCYHFELRLIPIKCESIHPYCDMHKASHTLIAIIIRRHCSSLFVVAPSGDRSSFSHVPIAERQETIAKLDHIRA
ncbi:GQ67_03083T0 [Komagataella phaffii]|nr:GQ67_03083T0 [Komagataella phaffii]AOA69268.1 GQ68_03067T0 [Komagataella phaffii GS115]